MHNDNVDTFSNDIKESSMAKDKKCWLVFNNEKTLMIAIEKKPNWFKRFFQKIFFNIYYKDI